MAPLPKRKHSTMRKGKRLATRGAVAPNLIICVNCGRSKLSHRLCLHCKK